MNLEQFISITYDKNNEYNTRNRIVCKDGFSFSVQGSKGHYCSPRENVKKYSLLEIGFPSRKEPLIISYAEIPEMPTETVYGYVPVSIIQEVIDNHKGIDINKTFKL